MGSGLTAAISLLTLSPGRTLALITNEAKAFTKLRQNPQAKLILHQLDQFLEKTHHHFLEKEKIYLQQLHDWEELDDFIKVKTLDSSTPTIPYL